MTRETIDKRFAEAVRNPKFDLPHYSTEDVAALARYALLKKNEVSQPEIYDLLWVAAGDLAYRYTGDEEFRREFRKMALPSKAFAEKVT